MEQKIRNVADLDVKRILNFPILLVNSKIIGTYYRKISFLLAEAMGLPIFNFKNHENKEIQ